MDLLWADNNTTSEAYTNDGDDTYTTHTDVATDFGLPEDVADHENMEWAWGDCDNDGALDLFVSGADNEGLYTNNGSGTFTSQGDPASITDPDG
ncbi:MAG: hypothetical protein K8I00_01085, partial [Candidatus Omnitrophica bacterium]|nr:hypothetical protein [Candidatus Omnitrophota bacterium]